MFHRLVKLDPDFKLVKTYLFCSYFFYKELYYPSQQGTDPSY